MQKCFHKDRNCFLSDMYLKWLKKLNKKIWIWFVNYVNCQMINSLWQCGKHLPYIFECCFERALQLQINLFCFIVNSVIEEDLAPWKNGITEEVFNTAKSNNYGSHYQIVNHKLYREEGCMFPARCVPVLVHYLHVTAACTHTVLVVSYLSGFIIL